MAHDTKARAPVGTNTPDQSSWQKVMVRRVISSKAQNALQQQAFTLMQNRQSQVNDAVSKYLTGSGQGFDPEKLAMLRTQFLNSTAQQYQTAGRNVRTALMRSGSLDSSVPAGGDAIR